jgi:hypothetical protein
VTKNIEAEKLFAFTIASVKDISGIIKEAMEKEYIHMALDLLEEEKKAMNTAVSLLRKIDGEDYHKAFGESIPNKLKDIEYAIKFCNNQLIEGKFILPSFDQEHKLNKKKQEVKIQNFKKLKKIAYQTKEWELMTLLDEEIEKAEMLKYQA